MSDILNDTLTIMPYHRIDNDDSTPVVTQFTCQREMIRDYGREAALNDGFAYWRTTGRLVVTWHNGAVTYIEYKEPIHSPVVLDCGYDESMPF